MASIPFVSVNIEGSKHLDLVKNFLAAAMPEVVCVQELFEADVGVISEALDGAQAVFLPMNRRDDSQDDNAMIGVGIFSRLPIRAHRMLYYRGDPAVIHDYDNTSVETRYHSQNCGVLTCDIEKDGVAFRVATTHFTWTPKGAADDFQRVDLKSMLEILETLDEFILCGDFNAPRVLAGVPGEIFGQLAARYKDNIPTQYVTSLDPARHHAPLAEQADKMVDGLFTTPSYVASNVELHTGVSDHCAITATISCI